MMKKKLIYQPYRIMYQKEKLQKIRDEGWCYPSTFSFLLNDSCNQNCIGCCSANFKNKNYFPLEKVPALIKDLKEMDCKNMEFCGGGEPTMHPQFEKIVKMFGEDGNFILGVITNGTLMKQKFLDSDLAKYFNYIRVSVDASNPKTYNSIRRSDDFDKVITGIKSLVDYKKKNNLDVNVSIRFLMFKDNIHEMISMYDLAERLGVDAVNFRAARNCDNMITPRQEERYTEVLSMLKNEYNQGKLETAVFGSLRKSCLRTPKCWLHWLWLIVTSNGDVLLCCWYQDRYESHVVGNVFKNSLPEIYQSKRYKEVADKIDMEKCNLYDCRYHEYNEIYQEWLNDGDTIKFI